MLNEIKLGFTDSYKLHGVTELVDYREGLTLASKTSFRVAVLTRAFRFEIRASHCEVLPEIIVFCILKEILIY